MSAKKENNCWLKEGKNGKVRGKESKKLVCKAGKLAEKDEISLA